MVLGIMKKGDEVLSVNENSVAVKRKNGEVDIIPFIKEGSGWRVDTENIVTIGYGENVVTYEEENGIKVINF